MENEDCFDLTRLIHYYFTHYYPGCFDGRVQGLYGGPCFFEGSEYAKAALPHHSLY